MRLFVAVVPPDAVRRHLADAVGPLREDSPDALRWVPDERRHLTLAFLGQVPEERVPRLRDALAAALAERSAPQVHLAGGGAFGGTVLWVGVGGDVDGLSDVARAVARAARGARVPVERREWRAHLTLARARGRVDLPAVRDGLRDYVGPSWPVADAVLMHSHLGTQPRHEPLAVLALRPGT